MISKKKPHHLSPIKIEVDTDHQLDVRLSSIFDLMFVCVLVGESLVTSEQIQWHYVGLIELYLISDQCFSDEIDPQVITIIIVVVRNVRRSTAMPCYRPWRVFMN